MWHWAHFPRSSCDKRKNDADGIADRWESSAVQKMSLSDFVSGELGRYASGIAEMTYRSEPSWMFCGSIRPETDWELEGMCRELRRAHFPDYDCVTTISNPSEFARQLGIDVGSVNHASVKLNQLEYWKRQLLRLRRDPFRRVVFVHHGPVIYRDTPYSFIERFSENERGLVAQFVKRTKFAVQRGVQVHRVHRWRTDGSGAPLRRFGRIEKPRET